MPEGVRFIGPTPGLEPRWPLPLDAPADEDLAACVACGLCLPHCPTYRVTGEESASPRGRITAMRSVAEGRSEPDVTFARFMDLCLVCRACEDVCPSHVPFGRMMERARVQIEPLRSRRARLLRWLGLEVVLPRKKLLWLAAAVQPVGRIFLPRRTRDLVPRRIRAVPAAAARHRAARYPPRDGRPAERLRAGSVVPERERGNDPRPRAQRLAGRRPEVAAVLRSAGRPPRASRYRPRGSPSAPSAHSPTRTSSS